MPNQPKTIARNMRIPDEVWEAALRGTVADGTTVTAVVVEFLRERYMET